MLRFGFLGLELFIFFGRRGVVLRRVFVAFVFLLLFFFLGGVEDVFVIGISRVSVWPFGFGII